MTIKKSVQTESILNVLNSKFPFEHLEKSGANQFEFVLLPGQNNDLAHILDLNLSLNSQFFLSINKEGQENRIPIGYLPVATDYGTVIINGIERAPVYRLVSKPGLAFYANTEKRKAVIHTSFLKKLSIEYDIKSSKCTIKLYSDKYTFGFDPDIKKQTVFKNEQNFEKFLLPFDKTGRKDLNTILNKRSTSARIELKDIESILKILLDEKIFSEFYPQFSGYQIENQRLMLLGDSLIKPLNRLFTVKNDSEWHHENIRGILPRNLRLRNEFRNLGEGSQFPVLNRLNPLSIISDCRKIKRGPLNVESLQIPKKDRDIHESHKNRICAIETPEADEIGLTLFLTKDAQIDPNSGAIRSGSSILGYSASLIPFIGHNEGARAIMGSKNMKQSLLLKHNEPPFIKTGIEREIAEFAKSLNDPLQKKFIVNDELALGVNLFVAYLPYKGYNFEDAIVISDRLQREDILTSVHYHVYKTEVFADEEVDILVSVGKEVEFNKSWCIKKRKNVREEEFCIINDKIYGVVDSIEKISICGYHIPLEEDFPFREPIDSNRKLGVLKIKIKEFRKIQLGDKLTGRHGNKGVIGAIIPENEMPKLPDGKSVDVILNPNGIISRMNLGQLLETHFALLYKYRYEVDINGNEVFDKSEVDFIENAGKAFQKTDPEKLSELLKKLLNHLYASSPQSCFSSGKVFLTDGQLGKKYDNPSTIGYQYFFKLNHLSSSKISIRSEGTEYDYDQISLQPLKGKKRNGGQRIGEMEFAALFAHDVPKIMNEILNVKSEFKKNEHHDKMPQATKAFFHYLHGLGLHAKLDDNKFSIEMLTDETLLKELGAVEIRGSEYFEPFGILRYVCKCGKKVLKVRTTWKQTISDNIFSSDLNDKYECAVCKKLFSSSIAPDNRVKIVCNCGEIILGLSESKKIRENSTKEKSACRCDNCNSELEVGSKVKFGSKVKLRSEVKFGYKFFDDGIFSEKIFGERNSNSWRESYGYIKLVKPVPHPFKDGMEIYYLPVIPPAYRPSRLNNFTLKPEGSYINELYKRIIKLNYSGEEFEVSKLKTLIDKLMIGEKSQKNIINSILYRLQGKKGLIRQSILGRRLDYSARAVIIPAPDINFDECKLSYPILKKFFSKEIQNKSDDRIAIKEFIRKEKPIVLLNRAPSLHKYNILAFYISESFYEDTVIGINPLVCGGYGADHDGDQMAVHLVITNEAKAEAIKMLPSNNLISDANSEPFMHFEQDIVLGLDIAFKTKEFWNTIQSFTEEDCVEKLISDINSSVGNTKQKINIILKKVYQNYGSQICSALVEKMMQIGFDLATKSGISISFFDLYELNRLFEGYSVKLPENPTQEDYEEYESVCLNNLNELLNINKSNSVVSFVATGARGNPKQVLQMVGLKGISYTGRDKFSDKFFIKSNFVNGLSEEEYFYAAFKSRDSMMDKKLMAPVTGTILRDLTNALFDVIISEHDCGSDITKRTPFTCLSKEGVCQICYGNKPLSVDYYPIGTQVGIIAAQSIGERSSQLSMKSVHDVKKSSNVDIESMNKLVNVSFPKKSETANYLLESYLPEKTYIRKFKNINAFSGVDDRHFSVLLRQILNVELIDEPKVQDYSIEIIEDLISKKQIKGYTLKQIIHNRECFFSRFGYSQTEKILVDMIDKSEISNSTIKTEFFLGVV